MRILRTLAAAALLLAAVRPAVAAPQQPRFQPTAEQTAFLDDLSERTFRYFWDTTDPRTCLAPDRWPSNPFSSIASVGFALNAYAIGAERGYVTRAEAARRTRDCLRFFWKLPQGPQATGVAGYKGFFYHFLDHPTGLRHGTTELSSVDTTLFLGGALFAAGYFDDKTADEREIRKLADQLYARVEWTFMQRNRTGTQAKNLANSHAIAMGWKPERGFETHDWVGYNEGMLVYVLALGSPTHPVGKDAWDQGWAAKLGEDWGSYMGQTYLTFEPLFGHQYSHIWVDFRGITEPFIASKGIDYFENSRRATLAQQAYGAANPLKWRGYSGDVWGWTASDGPGGYKRTVDGVEREFQGYSARGVSPDIVRDDGTIVPTAPGGSIPFAPEVTIPALMAIKQQHPRVWDRYGFKDAFNPSFTFAEPGLRTGTVDPQSGWVAGDYLGIDQGPILAMAENHRSDLIWRVMRRDRHVRRGLQRIGFTGGWLDQPSVAAPPPRAR